jgi:hypothetical protein
MVGVGRCGREGDGGAAEGAGRWWTRKSEQRRRGDVSGGVVVADDYAGWRHVERRWRGIVSQGRWEEGGGDGLQNFHRSGAALVLEENEKERMEEERAELAYDKRAPKSKVLNAPTVQHL